MSAPAKTAVQTPSGIVSIESIDDMPRFTQLLFSGNGEIHLSDEERRHFLLAEAPAEAGQKIAYLLLSKNIPSNMHQRAKSLCLLLRKTHQVRVVGTTREILGIIENQLKTQQNKEAKALVNESELYDTLNELFARTVEMNASDIHFEAYEGKTDIKLRVNGILVKILEYAQEYSRELARILYNVLAAEGSKDIQFDETKMQSAIVEKSILGKPYRIRVQTAPRYPFGYSIALRMLPLDTKSSTSIEDLGYTHVQMKMLLKAGMRPTGALIFAGTTGSGKSTTLSTLIADKIKKTKGTKKVITIENPPEYVINGALQVNINDTSESATATFADAIKVAMRMDPDVLMIGEVRDDRSAKLLQDSVQSGHQVFTTVHAASALGIFERLVGLGFERAVLTSPGFLSLLVYQVLAPINCPHCSLSFDSFAAANQEELEKELLARVTVAVGQENLSKIKFRNVNGCDRCKQTGFLGRTVIAEMIEPDDHLLQFIRNEDYTSARDHWGKTGGVPLYKNVMAKILTGELDPQYAEDTVGYLSDEHEKV
jgi:type II secretory ATPase GspE/PulE/Tfp pilus assembly ATPase PilB-like protein